MLPIYLLGPQNETLHTFVSFNFLLLLGIRRLYPYTLGIFPWRRGTFAIDFCLNRMDGWIPWILRIGKYKPPQNSYENSST